MHRNYFLIYFSTFISLIFFLLYISSLSKMHGNYILFYPIYKHLFLLYSTFYLSPVHQKMHGNYFLLYFSTFISPIFFSLSISCI
ncbi:hypothetical protein C0J52_00185 [Blattella germanica]|nr:hypothetical protein C0J52_00185 [Blattella germanica]